MSSATYLILGSTGGIGRVLCERLAKRGAAVVLGGRDSNRLDELAATNLGSAFYLVRSAAKVLRGGGGSIVLVSSAAARTGMVNHEAIAAAKAANSWVTGQVIGVDGGLATLRGREPNVSVSSVRSEPVVIVGAGVSGLCCALHLQDRGIPILVLEADSDVGGRVRTDQIDGFQLDRGFQILLTAYPEARDMLDLDALRLGTFAPGAIVRRGGRFARVADPFRRPADALRTLISGVATPMDALRIARLRRRVARGAPQALLEGASRETLTALHAEGFSERIIEQFFRPFLGGVLLDRELRGSSRALEFLFRMFAEGDATLPELGMGAIPAQLAARLAPGTIRTRTRVAQLDRASVRLESGERIDASAVVVATAARAAAKLVPGLPIPESNPACCLQFDAPRAPAVGDFLVLDGNAEGPVNELCVPSTVAPGYAPSGRALVSASVLEPVVSDDGALEAAARRQLTGWFGAEVSGWRLLRIDRIPDALPSQPPGRFEPAGRRAQLSDRLFVCGDYRDLASLQGAMASGRRAAVEVAGARG